MIKGLVKVVALGWVKKNAVSLLAYGILFLIDEYKKVIPWLTDNVERLVDNVLGVLYTLDQDVALYFDSTEATKLKSDLNLLFVKTGEHLTAFATKNKR